MEILGFEVELPGGLRVEQTSSGEGGTCIDIVGKNAESFSAAIVDQAVAAGFSESNREADRVELDRGEQRLLLVRDSEGLTIQTYDPTELDTARFDGSAVLLGDLRLDCGTTSIVPLRERYLQDKQLRLGAWKLSGVSARNVVKRVLDGAVASKGLTLGGIFEPPRGGREVWSGEAYSRVELVKVRATVEPGHVLLEVDLVVNRTSSRTGSENDAHRRKG
jgi:hypothetical protein